MKITMLDTKTGDKKTIDSDLPAFWWAENNGACDCNRAEVFGLEEEMEEELRKKHPELKEHQSVCYGCKRFLIIECNDNEYSLSELNSDYPHDLLMEHGVYSYGD